jgi:xanthine dehydrogenase accessory factor
MRDVLQDLEEAIGSGKPVAYTALVETRGSTPQKSGATMLVFPDGSQTGTLGGGCVEAEVKRRSLRLLDAGHPEILTFHLDENYGWDDGLICGGRMRLLVDPIRPGGDDGYFTTLARHVAEGRGCTEAVLLDPQATGGGLAADRWLLDDRGQTIASRSHCELPDSVTRNLKPLEQRPRPYIAAGISFLPRLHRCRLIIVGGGHVGRMVASLAHEADFEVWVIDDRDAYCSPDRFPFAKRLIVGPIDTCLSGLEIDASTFCIIVTRGHQHDEEALYHLAETRARFVGMIGSKRKIKLIFDDLLREGISRQALERVHAPLGLPIGSQTVSEIAISIVAELIACRNLEDFPQRYRNPNLLEPIAAPSLEEKTEC